MVVACVTVLQRWGGGRGIYWRWSGEAVGKHAEVGVIDSPRRVFEGYMYLSLKK